jgi:hypothetical protein
MVTASLSASTPSSQDVFGPQSPSAAVSQMDVDAGADLPSLLSAASNSQENHTDQAVLVKCWSSSIQSQVHHEAGPTVEATSAELGAQAIYNIIKAIYLGSIGQYNLPAGVHFPDGVPQSPQPFLHADFTFKQCMPHCSSPLTSLTKVYLESVLVTTTVCLQ